MLSDAEPLTEAEKRQIANEWAKRTLGSLLAYADLDPAFAKSICEKVIDKFGSDDKLSGIISKRLRLVRMGKPRAKPRKWNNGRYRVLLDHYSHLKNFYGREKALNKLAEMEGLSGDNAAKKIEDRIAKARKIFGAE